MITKPINCVPCQPDSGIPAFGFRIGIALALAGQGMVFGLGYNNALGAGEAPAFGSTLYWALHAALIASALAVGALLGGPLLRETYRALRARRLSVEALFVLSAVGAFVGSLISTLRGTGSVYYEVVSIVLCVYAIGKQIGAIQKGKIGEAVASFREAFDTATVLDPDGRRKTIRVKDLSADHRVLVLPGDPVPADGIIERGGGYIRETALTGEPTPVSKGVGARVMAGTWSVDGTLEIRPDPGSARTIDEILKLLEQAPQAPSRLQESADQLMQVFIPFVSLVSVATFFGWFLFSEAHWLEALFNAMAVLLVACPCALGLAMPTGIWAGLYYLGQRGIVGRHGYLLDSLAECTTIVFDKTGTLSRFELEAEASRLNRDVPGIDALVASLGKSSQHPVSGAISWLSEAALPVRNLHIHPGKGLSGMVDGHELVVGESSLLEESGIEPLQAEAPSSSGKPVHVAVDGSFAGTLYLQEVLREEAEASLEDLARLGCICRIMSGDPSASERVIGGVSVESGLRPEEKSERIRELVHQGEHVLFVGDGVNDLPAMEASQASLAIDLGAALATEFSDGLLVNGRISALPAAIRHARKLKRDLRGNLIFALAYNLIGMSLAAAGFLHPVVAALLMVGSSLVVSVRALRAAAASV